MKITCTQRELVEAINAVSKAVAVKPPTQILSGICLRATGAWLELEANNLDLGIKTKIPVNTETEGSIVVSGKFFQETARKLSGDIISIDYDDEAKVVTIRSDSGSYKLLAMPVEDWMPIKEPEVEVSFAMPAITLKSLIRKTVYACSNDAARPMFTGCLLQIDGSNITMVGTNTHRMAVMREQIADDLGDMKFIIPSKALWELLRLADASGDKSVSIRCSQKDIDFTFDNIYIKTRLLDGDFPQFEKVIPKEPTVTARIDTEELLAAIDRVGLISKETDYKTIKFVFKGDELQLSSTSPEIGNAEETIPVQSEGGEFEISFNVNYLNEALKVIDTKTCVFKMSGRLKPADIREADRDDFIYIVTPIRTN
ncbi:MAG: DNA polymerase III subunit beta [Selenomonadaceae bacterium]|nr:DNA polymerase III subunit beta [Selenomonadaceae bacterium]